MLEFQEEDVADVWDELYPLAEDHHRSTENYKRHEPFAPSRDLYLAYQNAGMFHLITARDHGRLVGYFGVYFMRSMHSQLPIAREDVLYLDPAYRHGRHGLRFVQAVEQMIHQYHPQGVEILFSCEQDNASGIHGLLKLLHYEPVISVYSKFLPPRADSAPPSVMESAHDVPQ